MKEDFIKLRNKINQIEKHEMQLSSLIIELKNSIKNIEDAYNPNGLLIVSNSIKNVDVLINCVSSNIKVFKYDDSWSYNTFNSNLEKILYEFEPNQLKLVGWAFDNNGMDIRICSDYVLHP